MHYESPLDQKKQIAKIEGKIMYGGSERESGVAWLNFQELKMVYLDLW